MAPGNEALETIDQDCRPPVRSRLAHEDKPRPRTLFLRRGHLLAVRHFVEMVKERLGRVPGEDLGELFEGRAAKGVHRLEARAPHASERPPSHISNPGGRKGKKILPDP